MEILANLSWVQWVFLIVSGLLIGVNKTAIPGIGVLPVVMLTSVFEARLSTGLQLGMLAITDIMAVIWYRRHADWKILPRLFPWALLGLACGSLILWLIPEGNDKILRQIVGAVVIALILLGILKERLKPESIPSGVLATAFFGVILGVSTQLANSAGPVAAVYLLAMKLPKEKYMGTSAWFFLLLNWTKLPIFMAEGRITLQSLEVDLLMLPILIIGAVIGILLFKRIKPQLFEILVRYIALAGAIKLLF